MRASVDFVKEYEYALRFSSRKNLLCSCKNAQNVSLGSAPVHIKQKQIDVQPGTWQNIRMQSSQTRSVANSDRRECAFFQLQLLQLKSAHTMGVMTNNS